MYPLHGNRRTPWGTHSSHCRTLGTAGQLRQHARHGKRRGVHLWLPRRWGGVATMTCPLAGLTREVACLRKGGRSGWRLVFVVLDVGTANSYQGSAFTVA